MTRDYAKPSTTRKKPATRRNKASRPRRSTPSKTRNSPPVQSKAKLIPLLVILLGGFIYALYTLQNVPPAASPENTNTQASKKASQKQSATKTETSSISSEQAPPQRFKFYDILPETEVIPPKVDTYTYKEKGKSDNYYYMVQTGSFRSRSDAEKQKATIAFQGLKAQIKAVKNDNGSTWYRVITGPFYNRSSMNSALDKLVAIRIEPLVKKVKK